MIEAEACSHSWSFDKTKMIDTRVFNHGEISQQERIDIRGVLEEVLQVHGVLCVCFWPPVMTRLL
jgi:hypothetical protein